MAPMIPPAVPVRLVTVAPTLLEDEDDFFLPNDDSSSGTPEPSDISPYMMGAHNDNNLKSSLAPIVEQPDSADKAVAILEDFFFGGNSARSKETVDAKQETTSSQSQAPSTVVQRSSSWGQFHSTDDEVESSPTSVAHLPKCSCSAERQYLFTGLNTVKSDTQDDVGLTSSDSMPTLMRRSSSSCSPKPVKPTLRVSSSSSLNGSKRNVSFTEISVREYDVELSDHPSCSFGPPIQLGWDYEEKEKMPLEDYEVTRSPRREVHELVLSYNARRRRLKQSGYKKKEIQAVEKEVDRIKRERLVTEFFLPAMAIDETLERVFVGLKQVFRRKHVCDLHP